MHALCVLLVGRPCLPDLLEGFTALHGRSTFPVPSRKSYGVHHLSAQPSCHCFLGYSISCIFHHSCKMMSRADWGHMLMLRPGPRSGGCLGWSISCTMWFHIYTFFLASFCLSYLSCYWGAPSARRTAQSLGLLSSHIYKACTFPNLWTPFYSFFEYPAHWLASCCPVTSCWPSIQWAVSGKFSYSKPFSCYGGRFLAPTTTTSTTWRLWFDLMCQCQASGSLQTNCNRKRPQESNPGRPLLFTSANSYYWMIFSEGWGNEPDLKRLIIVLDEDSKKGFGLVHHAIGSHANQSSISLCRRIKTSTVYILGVKIQNFLWYWDSYWLFHDGMLKITLLLIRKGKNVITLSTFQNKLFQIYSRVSWTSF